MIPTLLVTGGAGFIGSNFVCSSLRTRRYRVVTLDKLTYAGNLDNLASVADHPDHVFVKGDIADRTLVEALLMKHNPDAVVHFAAESHVDRSIDGPAEFIRTNVVGTFELLEAVRAYRSVVDARPQEGIRFVHVSTDEVYGSLGRTGVFTETTPYAPNSPYAASKAGSDHLVRAYHHTYGLPTVTTHCSNNYGPYQFPEKLIPLMILNALTEKPLPVYGDGANVRDWLHVEDHCDALRLVIERGPIGETYGIGGRNECSNFELVKLVCQLLDEQVPRQTAGRSYAELIAFVTDRPGHDKRYAIDPSKAERDLGWHPTRTLAAGLRDTVAWYVAHRAWCDRIIEGTYQGERLGRVR